MKQHEAIPAGVPPISFAAHQVRTGGLEGARADFEKMIADLACATVTGVRVISANPGDWGIDAFAGDLDGAITVWQAKYFHPITTASHKRQIEESFDSVIKATGKQQHTVHKWVLCIPSSMDPSATQWWDAWKKANARTHNVDIELWDETELRKRLSAPAAESVRRMYFEPYAAASPAHAPQPPPLQRLPGHPIAECDPFALEVHPSIKRAGSDSRELPRYVPRNHDALLRAKVGETASGKSQMVVLVGEPSTGKTRAMWEAVRLLPPSWRLWHPLSVDDLLSGLATVRPSTVLWLNHVDKYLSRDNGERAAVGLRNLLRDMKPVLVLGTIWSHRLDQLTIPSRRINDDTHQHARDLLTMDVAVTDVPHNFTGPDMDAARAAADSDPRLRAATLHAADGRIAQYLAGVPALVARCQRADSHTEAVLKAAMDLCRYGHDPDNLPSVLLKHAASAYIPGEEWDRLPRAWFRDALEYLGQDCLGVLGPLTRRRPRFGLPDESCYRLAGVLTRWAAPGQNWPFPAEGFWEAAALHARTPADWFAMGEEAQRYGRYRHAARLFHLAAKAGSQEAWKALVEFLEILGRADEATTVAQHSGQPHVMQELTEFRTFMETAFAWAQGQQPAVVVHKPGLLELKMRHLEKVGRWHEAVECAVQASGQGDVDGLDEALRLLEKAGERKRAEDLAIGSIHLSYLLGVLVQLRVQAGDRAGAERVALEAADHGHPDALGELARIRESAGRPDEAAAIRRYGLTADGSPADPWRAMQC
ncbi:tetratricopeptide repeat protein [Streptomyces sp. LN325]|uniref:tetratricopeptide repeat protein n=1 Tax=Streptomyces sp. LN325 TaxID=3112976 RepID=UPI0037204F63